jgi:hypothetical protein
MKKRKLNEFVSPEKQIALQSEIEAPQEGMIDKEGEMAKADLYKLAKYSHKLFKKIDDNDQLESWVQAKITKAADYIASVYHFLEYEMKFSEYGAKLENSEIYSESQKAELRKKLTEARQVVSELKKTQAAKLTTEAATTGLDTVKGLAKNIKTGAAGLGKVPQMVNGKAHSVPGANIANKVGKVAGKVGSAAAGGPIGLGLGVGELIGDTAAEYAPDANTVHGGGKYAGPEVSAPQEPASPSTPGYKVKPYNDTAVKKPTAAKLSPAQTKSSIKNVTKKAAAAPTQAASTKDDEILTVQQNLIQQGYRIKPTGVFDKPTQQAFYHYMSSNNQPISEKIKPKTKEKPLAEKSPKFSGISKAQKFSTKPAGKSEWKKSLGKARIKEDAQQVKESIEPTITFPLPNTAKPLTESTEISQIKFLSGLK